MALCVRGAAIVSGGASGLGRACVERLHDEGLRVLIADLNAELGAELAARLGDGRRSGPPTSRTRPRWTPRSSRPPAWTPRACG